MVIRIVAEPRQSVQHLRTYLQNAYSTMLLQHLLYLPQPEETMVVIYLVVESWRLGNADYSHPSALGFSAASKDRVIYIAMVARSVGKAVDALLQHLRTYLQKAYGTMLLKTMVLQ
jgi:hypothetical protein